MVTKLTWVTANGKPNLKIDFSNVTEKNKFLNDVKNEATKSGLNFPMVSGVKRFYIS